MESFLLTGRPRRAKTRAPTRPITDQSQDIDEGMLCFINTTINEYLFCVRFFEQYIEQKLWSKRADLSNPSLWSLLTSQSKVMFYIMGRFRRVLADVPHAARQRRGLAVDADAADVALAALALVTRVAVTVTPLADAAAR